MARILTEGFETMSFSNAIVPYNGIEIKTNSSVNGHNVGSNYCRKNGYGLIISGSINYYYYSSKTLSNLEEVYCRLWFTNDAISPSSITDGTTNIICSIRNNSTNLVYVTCCKFSNEGYVLKLYNKNNELLWTSTLLLYGRNFDKIDIHYKIDTTTSIAYIDFKLNDETVSKTSFSETSNLKITSFDFGVLDVFKYNSHTFYFDDMAINDTSGTMNNSWCGNGHCELLVPISNGSIVQFTPSSGSNYSCVDDKPFNTSDYNSTTTDGAIDLFKVTNLAGKGYTSTNKINSMRVCLSAKYTESIMNVIPYMKINGTVYEETKNILTTSFTQFTKDYLLNPITSTQLTVGDIDNSEFGYKSIVGV